MPRRAALGIAILASSTLGTAPVASAEAVAPIVSPSAPAAAAPAAAPRVIENWEPGMPLSPGYHTERQAHRGPVIAGPILFGVSYGLSVLAALATDVANSDPDLGDPGGKNNHTLFIPVLGPFFDATQSWTDSQKRILVVDGLAQAAGAALLVYGLTSSRTVLVRDRPLMTVAPLPLGRDAAGLAVAGTF